MQNWAFPAMFLGFAILGSVFPFHTWSPAGHASAPTAISMFLAGVHMKLGGYGCLRIAMYLMPEGAADWMPVFLVLATISVVYGAFIAIRQRDLKFINAYSSISHVGLVTFAFAALGLLAVRGGVLQMISHGFVTALVFALIGAIYGRTHTRIVDELGGLMAKDALPRGLLRDRRIRGRRHAGHLELRRRVDDLHRRHRESMSARAAWLA